MQWQESFLGLACHEEIGKMQERKDGLMSLLGIDEPTDARGQEGNSSSHFVEVGK